MQYTKPCKSFEDQIQLLNKRGLITNHDSAQHLSHLNYYRLAGYMIPFQEGSPAHTFKPTTTFSDILNLYFFDRELRLLMLDAIERIEISIRTQWAYHFSNKEGPHDYLKEEICISNV